MTTRQAAASENSPPRDKGVRPHSAIIAAGILMLLMLLALGLFHTLFPDRLMGEGRAARESVLAKSDELALSLVERAFTRSSIDPADLAAIQSAAPAAFDLNRCVHSYRTRYRSVWDCRFELHVAKPFEVHIADAASVHLRNTISIPSMFTKEPQVISMDTGNYPRLVETFGVVPDADR